MSLQKSALESLEHEYSLLRLLHHRNKNQHRVATWWKHLNTLKRDLTKLVALLNSGKKSGAQKESVLKLGYHVRKVVVPKCHRAFHGIVALGQFLTLGLTLLGMLAKLDSCMSKIEGLDEFMASKRRSISQESKGVSDRDVAVDVSGIVDDLGEEIGEVVEMKTIDNGEKKRKNLVDPEESIVKKKKKKIVSDSQAKVRVTEEKKKKKEKKEKKKKGKSAIDDIFG